MQLPS